MPELPEVESLRLSLIPRIVGSTIQKVRVLMPKLVSSKGTTRTVSNTKVAEFINGLEDTKIVSINRRAKNLIFNLSSGGILLVHLKMTGQLAFKSNKNSHDKAVIGGHPIQESELVLPNKHSYIIMQLDNGNLYYNDVRQFGYLLYFKSLEVFEAEGHFENLGLEPLDQEFIWQDFYTKIKGKTGNIKKLFLDQTVVVGLGNIYADEVLFRAGVLPTRNTNSLTKVEIKKIFEAILVILPKAVNMGGSSVANYIMADGSRGTYAHEHMVYGRGGKECLVCGTILQKTVIASRTTVFCPECQK